MNAEELYPPFVYNTGSIALTSPGTTPLPTLSIQSSLDFAATMMTIVVTQANLVVTNFGGTIQVEDASEKWFNLPLTIASLIGSGLKAYGFPPYRRIAGTSNLIITVVNNTATATSVDVALHGFRVPKGKTIPRHYLYALTPQRVV